MQQTRRRHAAFIPASPCDIFFRVTPPNLNGQLTHIVEELVRRGMTLSQACKEFERRFIVSALRHHDGNVSRSARHLGIHRNTLRNKVTSLEITSDEVSERRSARSKSS